MRITNTHKIVLHLSDVEKKQIQEKGKINLSVEMLEAEEWKVEVVTSTGVEEIPESSDKK